MKAENKVTLSIKWQCRLKQLWLRERERERERERKAAKNFSEKRNVIYIYSVIRLLSGDGKLTRIILIKNN